VPAGAVVAPRTLLTLTHARPRDTDSVDDEGAAADSTSIAEGSTSTEGEEEAEAEGDGASRASGSTASGNAKQAAGQEAGERAPWVSWWLTSGGDELKRAVPGKLCVRWENAATPLNPALVRAPP